MAKGNRSYGCTIQLYITEGKKHIVYIARLFRGLIGIDLLEAGAITAEIFIFAALLLTIHIAVILKKYSITLCHTIVFWYAGVLAENRELKANSGSHAKPREHLARKEGYLRNKCSQLNS